ncbi:MAG: class I SAM-dependent methyltransferase [Sphingomonas sp.]
MLDNSPVVSLAEWHARILNHADGNHDSKLPPLPSRAIQEQFVGSSLKPAFEEAFIFYSTFMEYSAALGMPFSTPYSRFLDFGCGWGRFLRYAMNDFERMQLFATDIDPAIIDACVQAGIPAQYEVLQPLGKLPYPDEFFSHAIGYSVFTHLPENVHLNWSAEIIRVLKPGGLFCGTIETRKFLEFIQTMPDVDRCTNDWHRALSRYKPQTTSLLKDYDAGKFVYLPTGGGGVRTTDIYGEAVISPKYIETTWHGMSLRAVLDERFWQTVFIVQKN